MTAEARSAPAPALEDAGRLFARFRAIMAAAVLGLCVATVALVVLGAKTEERQDRRAATELLRAHAYLVDSQAFAFRQAAAAIGAKVAAALAGAPPNDGAAAAEALAALAFDPLAAEGLAPNLDGLGFLPASGGDAFRWFGAPPGDAAAAAMREAAGLRDNPTAAPVWAADAADRALRLVAPVEAAGRRAGYLWLALDPGALLRMNAELPLDGAEALVVAGPLALGRPGAPHPVAALDDGPPLSAAARRVAADPRSHPAGDLAAVESGLVFAQPLAHAPWTALVALDAARMERAALLEVSARLGGLIALIALTLALAASLIRREFIRPAEALVADIVAAGEGRDDGDVDRAPAGWRPYFRRIRRLFRENTEAAALRRELAIAARMQASVLPKRFPGADAPVAAWGLARPAREVGGDFFDLFELPDGRLGFVVADVSGKGVPAALFMVLAHTLTRAAAAEAPSPASCLARVNRLLADENAETMFVTMALGVFDPASGRVVYANAGHNPPYLLGVGAPPRALGMPPGAALGVFEDAAFEDAEARLAPGETLLLFTDGVTEAMDRSGEEYGEDRLVALLARVGDAGPEGLIEAVAADVDAFAAGAPQADDLPLLALRRAASPPPLAATLGPDLAEIAVFADRLERWSEEAG
ncbi:MAG: SpoIIE family protein phosphatase, partial [Pseudomonadota bacterium]